MEYLVALLTTLALELPVLTGQPIPDMTSLPTLEVADHLDQMVLAHTGQWAGGELTTAAYMPRENLIFENRWRREHGLSPRSELSGPVRHHP
jgi:hypothetical protein